MPMSTQPRIINEYAGTSVTASLDDLSAYCRFTGSDPTYTLPNNSTVALPIGAQIDGVGVTTTMTVAAGSGVTINRARSLVTNLPMSGWAAIKVGTNEFDLHGDFL